VQVSGEDPAGLPEQRTKAFAEWNRFPRGGRFFCGMCRADDTDAEAGLYVEHWWRLPHAVSGQ